MIRLSVPLRQALARLVLPLLVAASFALMLLGKADALLAERMRTRLSDLLTPLYAVLAEPARSVRDVAEEVQELISLRTENARLREENARLRQWHNAALRLETEVVQLRAQLGFVPEARGTFRTAKVVADSGGAYARAVLIATGPQTPVARGQVAVDATGLVGRITDVGSRSARIMLITDLNSRIPVMVERTRATAMLTGTNGPRPRLAHWLDGSEPPRPGDRIVTAAQANAFPPGLPVGIVVEGRGGLEVAPAADLDRLEMVRVFDFGLSGILPPESVARPEPPARRRQP
ncbi:MAG: rod shape-determining protein MreC [Acetobacteraceae bacterium]|nr:rod shape-determining protein MreC [Acetobacteraceae bacterium]